MAGAAGGTIKDDAAVLFPEAMVEGYTLRPWTLAQAVALAPTLGALVGVVKESGIGEVLLNFMDLLEPGQGDARDAFAKAQKEVTSILPELIPRFLPHAPKIISVSAGISEEEAGAMDLGKATVLLLSIVTQNVDYLKNFFGPANLKAAKAS
jgi:membrane protein YqaA with SNARE-associated domain